ncbi:MAG: AarF/ABC1/UbiB kinase family protein [Anaerolineales bacterium]|jgi:predicted unusual protein kinase regulating ubiquinone biosynthesis (AarF/ABC1/UbiB family)|nr:AarF/ABC1/UbiB kinase family protein [Anaerolineales bacterium]
MIQVRYRRITWFFTRLLISLAFWDILLPRLGLRGFSKRTRSKRLQKAAISYRFLAIQMGGVLIKVGQFLSSRVDVLPPEFTRELTGLQDEVPAEKYPKIRQVIEAEFKKPISDVFVSFDQQPLAAASLGQVHIAKLRSTEKERIENGPGCQDVVVKVLRPNIEQVIETDLAALRTVGIWLNRYRPIRRRANVPALLDEFTRILYEEIDYLLEGKNAETFAANFKDYPGVYVPQVCWSHTTRRVLTLENVLAIKITDYQAISAAGVSRADVASRLLDTYLKQIFEDGFFHADPHPGNLFVQVVDGRAASKGQSQRAWQLNFVDFGMAGTVPPNLRSGLREMLIGVGTRDAARVVRSYQSMDLLLPEVDLARLETAQARVFDQFWGKNMTELTSLSYEEMRDLTDEFRDLVYEMPFQVPQNVIFLARCVSILSGMCTGLDPEFNLWAHLSPYARKIIAEETAQNSQAWLAEAEKLARTFLALPFKLDANLTRLEHGEIAVRTPEVSQQVKQLTRATRGLTAGVIAAAFLLSAVQLLSSGFELLAGASALVSLFFLVSAFIYSRNGWN